MLFIIRSMWLDHYVLCCTSGRCHIAQNCHIWIEWRNAGGLKVPSRIPNQTIQKEDIYLVFVSGSNHDYCDSPPPLVKLTYSYNPYLADPIGPAYTCKWPYGWPQFMRNIDIEAYE